VNGCILILVALGLSIVFGLMGIINFAHGIFYMLGAYAGWLTIQLTGSFWLALFAAPLAVGLVGVLVERGVLKRIYGTKNANFAGVLVTYGLAIMIPDLVRMTFGRPGKPFAIPEALSGSLFRIGALDVHSYRVFILVVTAALLPLLWLLLNKTNLGLVIRAGTSDNLMVQLLGINVARTWTTTYALGAALAAFAGVITAPLVAVAPGRVVAIDGDYGSPPHNVVIQLDDGNQAMYGHVIERSRHVQVGQRVEAGEVVANTGDSSSPYDGFGNPHVHLELRKRGRDTATNLVPWFDQNWDDLSLGANPGPRFERDLDNPRRYQFPDEQPDIRFGGAIITNFARPWPP